MNAVLMKKNCFSNIPRNDRCRNLKYRQKKYSNLKTDSSLIFTIAFLSLMAAGGISAVQLNCTRGYRHLCNDTNLVDRTTKILDSCDPNSLSNLADHAPPFCLKFFTELVEDSSIENDLISRKKRSSPCKHIDPFKATKRMERACSGVAKAVNVATLLGLINKIKGVLDEKAGEVANITKAAWSQFKNESEEYQQKLVQILENGAELVNLTVNSTEAFKSVMSSVQSLNATTIQEKANHFYVETLTVVESLKEIFDVNKIVGAVFGASASAENLFVKIGLPAITTFFGLCAMIWMKKDSLERAAKERTMLIFLERILDACPKKNSESPEKNSERDEVASSISTEEETSFIGFIPN